MFVRFNSLYIQLHIGQSQKLSNKEKIEYLIIGVEHGPRRVNFNSKNKLVKEQHLKFVLVTNLNGNALASTIVKKLTGMKIKVQYLRGQGYDGTMNGRFNGVRLCIKKNIKQLYIFYIAVDSLTVYYCNISVITKTWCTIHNNFAFKLMI